MEVGKTQENDVKRMVSIWEICDDHFCTSAGYTGALYGTYATDSLYLETALKHHATLVSLDENDFLLRIKGRVGIEIYHPREFS
ncbi:hypothetical protein [Candidatus Methanoperedens nitratireducens]|uniref:PIN domain-containing protein n=1 Tax=Candidatus Methanoperedens nitratireducens TaxID=1392998 RepID=A0A284VTZ0_9EURY|nr:hypothetical protein [Candidatus Methanoperedens nitroreducens]SNQ62764.1 hypothetical protein MNV_860022 [Candidatus Methanoperedens nitroreducens]